MLLVDPVVKAVLNPVVEMLDLHTVVLPFKEETPTLLLVVVAVVATSVEVVVLDLDLVVKVAPPSDWSSVPALYTSTNSQSSSGKFSGPGGLQGL